MSNPFHKPTTPKNSLQLLQWLIFEPILLERYENTLTKTQTAMVVLKAILVNLVFVITPLALVLYVIGVIIIAAFDLPLIFPPDISIDTSEVFVQQWQTHSTWWEKAYFFVSFNNYNSLIGLAFGLGAIYDLVLGLAFGLAFGLAAGLAAGLAVSLIFGLIFGLIGGLAFDLTVSLASGLAWGLVVGLILGARGLILGTRDLLFDLIIGLIISLASGLASGFTFGLVSGLASGLAFLLFFYLSYFRLWFYPWHFLKSLVSVSLTNNPYIGDGTIWLPIWGITRQLTVQAQQDPKTGLALVGFLLEHRPLQRQLTMHINHAVTAGIWQYCPLQKQCLLPPFLIQKTPSLTPSTSWLNQIEKLNQQLEAYEEEQQISLRKDQLAIFCTQLAEFEDLTKRESYRWHHYYLPAIKEWQTVANEKLVELTQNAQKQEPITPNFYRFSEILNPDQDQNIFFGREDIKEELKQQILTTRTMPMFLCYGQRRVGKSSLLKFLPRLLGSRFQVIYQDCEDAKVNSLHNWLKDLQQRLDHSRGETAEIDWQPTDNWLKSWGKMQHYLETLSHQQEEKIILAFDEYEALHERIFSTDPKQGERLLGAMRSFSQQQNQIVFLFVGATQFTDLKKPNWAQYFIHAMPLKVDYLRKKEAIRLITEPVDLNYPPEVIERMWVVTQGHPALLQMLCLYLVKIANDDKRKNMTLADLEQVITQKIVQRNTYALNAFWTEFCTQHQCHATIEEILVNQPITDKRHRLKLKDYGYIVPDGEGWKFRMPLLEMWLRRYREKDDGLANEID